MRAEGPLNWEIRLSPNTARAMTVDGPYFAKAIERLRGPSSSVRLGMTFLRYSTHRHLFLQPWPEFLAELRREIDPQVCVQLDEPAVGSA
jgi:hypothetical protein